MSSNRYRKKPVVIEAFRMEAHGTIPKWFLEASKEGRARPVGETSVTSRPMRHDEPLEVMTNHGWATVLPGDWIILQTDGEIYPCKPAIFEATYEAEDEGRGELSDGYHTFNELYQHRHALFLALLKERGGWACRTHADGTMYEGHFIAGMDLDGRQVSYHLPVELWAIAEDLGLAVDEAPEWDGHSSDEVALRLLEYAMSKEKED